jgi:rhodanese-related sulfurtransferase
MKIRNLVSAIALVSMSAVSGAALAASNTGITPSLGRIDVVHNGKSVSIERTASKDAVIPDTYARTSHACPPFCIQPMAVVSGVETVGELEVLGYLKRIADGDSSVKVVDSRTPDWLRRGTIPGSVNIPWTRINRDVEGTFALGAESEELEEILSKEFGARLVDGAWDFRTAKTLVLFCNGSWCAQSSTNIKTLARMGYPTYKLKWYRGGMQDWVSLGLTTVKN